MAQVCWPELGLKFSLFVKNACLFDGRFFC